MPFTETKQIQSDFLRKVERELFYQSWNSGKKQLKKVEQKNKRLPLNIVIITSYDSTVWITVVEVVNIVLVGGDPPTFTAPSSRDFEAILNPNVNTADFVEWTVVFEPLDGSPAQNLGVVGNGKLLTGYYFADPGRYTVTAICGSSSTSVVLQAFGNYSVRATEESTSDCSEITFYNFGQRTATFSSFVSQIGSTQPMPVNSRWSVSDPSVATITEGPTSEATLTFVGPGYVTVNAVPEDSFFPDLEGSHSSQSLIVKLESVRRTKICINTDDEPQVMAEVEVLPEFASSVVKWEIVSGPASIDECSGAITPEATEEPQSIFYKVSLANTVTEPIEATLVNPDHYYIDQPSITLEFGLDSVRPLLDALGLEDFDIVVDANFSRKAGRICCDDQLEFTYNSTSDQSSIDLNFPLPTSAIKDAIKNYLRDTLGDNEDIRDVIDDLEFSITSGSSAAVTGSWFINRECDNSTTYSDDFSLSGSVTPTIEVSVPANDVISISVSVTTGLSFTLAPNEGDLSVSSIDFSGLSFEISGTGLGVDFGPYEEDLVDPISF